MGNNQKKFNIEYSQSVPNTNTEDFSNIYVSPGAGKKLAQRTLYALMSYACEISFNSACIGCKDSVYTWISYGETWEIALSIGRGILNTGIYTRNASEVIGICSLPRHEVLLLDIALVSQSIPSLHFHPYDDISKILLSAQPLVIFCDESSVQAICSAKNSNSAIKLHQIVQFEQVMEKTRGLCRSHKINIINLKEVISESLVAPKTPMFSTIYTMVFSPSYTFNMITHSNAIATLEGVDIKIKNTDIYYSYLPLSSLQERILIYYVLKSGGRVGFGQDFYPDVNLLSPSVLILNRCYLKSLHKNIQNKTEARRLKKTLSKLRIIISNTLNIQPKVLASIYKVFECSILTIFGNNICGIMIISYNYDLDSENTGGPVVGLEISLKSSSPLGLSVNNVIQDKPMPKGIIYAKGNCISTNELDSNVLEYSNRGVNTNLIGYRNCHNGGIGIIGSLEFSFIINGKPWFSEAIESSFLEIDGISDVFVYESNGKIFGVGVVDNMHKDRDINLNNINTQSEIIYKWLYGSFETIKNLPYYLARKYVYEKSFETAE